MTSDQIIEIKTFSNLFDVQYAANLTRIEAWHNETELEISTFFQYDPEGCFICEINGFNAGVCIATAYQTSGFIGELIVEKQYRGHGIGRKLMETAIQYLQQKGVESIFLDGVQKAIPLYESLGFLPVCRSLRFFGQLSPIENSNVHPMDTQDLQSVIEIDQKYFGQNRGYFLRKRRDNYPHLALVQKKENKIVSYLFGRTGLGGLVSAGPWISLTDPVEDITILSHFQSIIGNQPFGIGVLENRITIIQELVLGGMNPRTDPPTRMVLGGGINLGDNPHYLAIGSPAKG